MTIAPESSQLSAIRSVSARIESVIIAALYFIGRMPVIISNESAFKSSGMIPEKIFLLQSLEDLRIFIDNLVRFLRTLKKYVISS